MVWYQIINSSNQEELHLDLCAMYIHIPGSGTKLLESRYEREVTVNPTNPEFKIKLFCSSIEITNLENEIYFINERYPPIFGEDSIRTTYTKILKFFGMGEERKNFRMELKSEEKSIDLLVRDVVISKKNSDEVYDHPSLFVDKNLLGCIDAEFDYVVIHELKRTIRIYTAHDYLPSLYEQIFSFFDIDQDWKPDFRSPSYI